MLVAQKAATSLSFDHFFKIRRAVILRTSARQAWFDRYHKLASVRAIHASPLQSRDDGIALLRETTAFWTIFIISQLLLISDGKQQQTFC